VAWTVVHLLVTKETWTLKEKSHQFIRFSKNSLLRVQWRGVKYRDKTPLIDYWPVAIIAASMSLSTRIINTNIITLLYATQVVEGFIVEIQLKRGLLGPDHLRHQVKKQEVNKILWFCTRYQNKSIANVPHSNWQLLRQRIVHLGVLRIKDLSSGLAHHLA